MDIFDRFLTTSLNAHDLGKQFIEEYGDGPVANHIFMCIMKHSDFDMVTVNRIRTRRGENSREYAKKFCREHERFDLVRDTADIDGTWFITWKFDDLPDQFERVSKRKLNKPC